MVVENWKPKIKVKDDWEMVKLGDICKKITDGSHNPPPEGNGEYLMLSSKNIYNDSINFENPRKISKKGFDQENKRTEIKPGDVLLTIVGTIGRSLVVPESIQPITVQRSVAVLKPSSKIDSYYLSTILRTDPVFSEIQNKAKGVAQKGIYLNDLKTLSIPLPDIDTQKNIVRLIYSEQKLIESNNSLIEIYEQKIKDRIKEVWGE